MNIIMCMAVGGFERWGGGQGKPEEGEVDAYAKQKERKQSQEYLELIVGPVLMKLHGTTRVYINC